MNLTKELMKIEKSISKKIISSGNVKFLSDGQEYLYFELSEYNKIFVELNRKRYQSKTYDEKVSFIKKYEKVFLSQRKMYRYILTSVKNDNLVIGREYNESERLKELFISSLKLRIYEINNELYRLRKFPYQFINTLSTFIGPYSVAKYRRDIIFYKDVFIMESESHHFSVFYNEKTNDKTKNAILNILAYFNGKPSFYFTENYHFNKKICDLYENFDLLDMIRLRKKSYFDSKRREPFYLQMPILKTQRGHDFLQFNDMPHEMVFELYHASLKQFEPLPRCVFLYRVFEYGSAYHYKPLFKPQEYKVEDALNYYVSKIMDYRFNPIYYVDFGTYESEDEKNIIRKRKPKYVNFISILKKEVKKIKKEWNHHKYLKNKSVGAIIYETGRNATAHGASGRKTARYDYAMNYKHINDVNIFLELIARYIIEKLNPQLSNVVEKRISYYIKYNHYEKIFEEERN